MRVLFNDDDYNGFCVGCASFLYTRLEIAWMWSRYREGGRHMGGEGRQAASECTREDQSPRVTRIMWK